MVSFSSHDNTRVDPCSLNKATAVLLHKANRVWTRARTPTNGRSSHHGNARVASLLACQNNCCLCNTWFTQQQTAPFSLRDNTREEPCPHNRTTVVSLYKAIHVRTRARARTPRNGRASPQGNTCVDLFAHQHGRCFFSQCNARVVRTPTDAPLVFT